MLYDVAVIGGGPIGSRVAHRLSQAGHKVIVLEKKLQQDEPICCTGIVSRECADISDINRNIIRRRTDGALIFSPSGKRLSVYRSGIQVCILDRVAFDREMAEQARSAGAEYHYGSRVEDIEAGRDAVQITGHNGREKLDVTARSVVIASGFGTKFPGLPMPLKIGDFATGVQAEVETNGIDAVEVYFDRRIAPGFFAWLVPVSAQKALVGLISYRDAGDRLKKLLTSLSKQGKIKSADVPILRRTLPFQPLPKTYGRRLVVAGSAAGQVKPLTGGGIYYGLLCADIAANTLHQALLTDDLSVKNLAVYEREWRKLLEYEIRRSYQARKILGYLSNRQLDRIFTMVQEHGYLESLLKMEELSFDWHSKVIKKLLREKFWSSLGEIVKVPFLR